jgi:hypothetical protein
MSSMGYAIQLAKLYRQDGEPPSLKVELINIETGGTQAFKWFDPAAESIDYELDWLKVRLDLVKTEKTDQ